jgi:hypothetical protein
VQVRVPCHVLRTGRAIGLASRAGQILMPPHGGTSHQATAFFGRMGRTLARMYAT